MRVTNGRIEKDLAALRDCSDDRCLGQVNVQQNLLSHAAVEPNISRPSLRNLGLAALGMLLAASAAQADSHAYITGNRSSANSYVYFQESLEAEYGHYSLNGSNGKSSSEAWQGSNLSSSLGTEMWKFLQVEAGYGALNLHKANDKLNRMSGTRLHTGLRLNFSAPLFNLELGAGLQASRLDHVNHEESATYYGTGSYVSIGLSYFLMTHLSVYSEIKYTTEHMKNTAGGTAIDTIDAKSTGGGLGFRIWF